MGILSDIPPNYVLIAGISCGVGLLIGYMIATWRRNGNGGRQ